MNIAGLVIGNMIDKLRKPENLKAGLIIFFVVFVISQLVLFFGIIPGKIDTAISFVDSIKGIFEKSILQIWWLLIQTLSLFLIQFKVFVYIAAVLVLIAGILVILLIPEEWLKAMDILVLLFVFACPFIILGIIFVELFPFLAFKSFSNIPF